MGRIAWFSALILALLSLLAPISADKCVIPGSEADIYNPGQKVIIAWDGELEYMILSTDLYSSTEGKVLEIIPLPSEPEVERGDHRSFEAVQRIIFSHFPKALKVPRKELKGVEIVFHERIGAHDITVVRADSSSELMNFIGEYSSKSGLKQLRLEEEVEKILEDYLNRRFNYWVLDLVEVGRDVKSIDPIVYKFRSDKLYYPLKVSRAAKGSTRITIYAITPSIISEESLPKGLKIAEYMRSGTRLSFRVSHEELKMIDDEIAELFDEGAWFTAIIYEGPLSDLREDLEVELGGCRSIDVGVDKLIYNVGENIEIKVRFIHLRPRCYEIMVLHYHEIRLEILDEAGEKALQLSWQTEEDLNRVVVWRPEKPGRYSIRASSWFNGEELEVLDEEIIEVKSLEEVDDDPEKLKWLIHGALLAMIFIILGAGLAYFLIKH